MADESLRKDKLLNESRTCKLFVGNLPKNALNAELENFFSEIGPIKQCFVVKDKGIGYVTFALREDAESAVKKVRAFNGRKLRLCFAREKRVTKLQKDDKKESDISASKAVNGQKKSKTASHGAKMKAKIKPINYKARMVVRNLAYEATEEDVRKAFGKYGPVIDVHLPKRPNGRLIGFGFVRMDNEQHSSNAIAGVNSQEILGRPVAVDWACSQAEYKKIKLQERELKGQTKNSREKCVNDMEENNSDSDSCISDEEDNMNTSDVEKNVAVNDMETSSATNSRISKEDDNSTSDGEQIVGTSDVESSSETDSCLRYEDGDAKEDTNTDDEEKQKMQKTDNKQTNFEQYSDTNQGKTVFIRNISFNTTREQLTEAFSKFGKVEYATICVDPVTDHPKGSGFVKFISKESAEECLSKAGMQSEDGEITLDGHKLLVSIALSKEATNKFSEDKKKKKDNRNLYLAREGLIRPGTKAAEGVSKEDMTKRMQLEDWKRKILQNLHMFISKTRLSVRNIPPSMSEKTLRRIFTRAGAPEARLSEVKIMRSKKKFDAAGTGISQGFGFVQFDEHEHALRVLREINNNPNIFTSSSRPIVEFTLENQAVLKAKKRRLENSRRKNKQIQEKNNKPDNKPLKKITKSSAIAIITGTFVGTKSDSLDSTKSKTLPSHFGPKIRHKKRRVASSAKALQMTNKLQNRKREERLAAQVKQRNRKEMVPPRKVRKLNQSEDDLDKLVKNYQRKFKPKEKKTFEKQKWFIKNT